MQLDNPERGFSFKRDGPLDLRMNPNHGQSAAAWLSAASETRLIEVLQDNADEPHARLIARSIVDARSPAGIATTAALARVIQDAWRSVPKSVRDAEGEAPVQRVFQALRIEVNDEFGALETLLRFLPDCLAPGGRVAILSFHSGEDRRVKKAFQAGLHAGFYARVAPAVIRPSAEEVRANPRSASAKLRWAIRAAGSPL